MVRAWIVANVLDSYVGSFTIRLDGPTLKQYHNIADYWTLAYQDLFEPLKQGLVGESAICGPLADFVYCTFDCQPVHIPMPILAL